MLETRNGLISLSELEQFLTQSLSHHNVGVVPRKISCLVRENNLMIMLHYEQTAMPYPRKLFGVVKEHLAQLLVSSEYQVLLYLVVQDQYQTNLLPSSVKVASPPPQTLPTTPSPQLISTQSIKSLRFPKFPKFALGGLGIVTAIFFGYLAQRHCLFSNSCALIPQANRLAKQAELIINYTPTDLSKALLELNNAQQLLQSIPSVSPHYREAQHLSQNYQQQSQAIENLLQADRIKTEALSLTQLPLNIETAQEIESLWNGAITLLANIPSDSNLTELAQARLAEFNAEKQTITSLKTAQEAAEIAKVRESVAQSLENWQLVAATWRTALERLASIPKDSKIAHEPEINQLATIYQSRLTQTLDRVQQETIATQFLQQAQEQAKLAQNNLDNKNWQTSVSYWRQAVEILNQIPQESSLFADAQILMDNYQQSLQQAQSQQAIALNLEQICSANIRICNYQIDSGVIKVELTPTYQEQLQQVALATSVQPNAPAEMELRQHLSGLEAVFQSISSNTGLPVEIYNAQQVLIVTYLP